MSSKEQDPGRPARPEAYIHTGSQVSAQVLSIRTLDNSAAFLGPYLRSGLHLLDCGCGPGTITCDLAAVVAPGEVVGIDADPLQIRVAREKAKSLGLEQIQFEEASIYELPFPTGSFDIVYCNAVLPHLGEPDRAIAEIYRVLKPGGIAGLRSGHNEYHIIYPPEPIVQQSLLAYMKSVGLNGGTPYVGQWQHVIMREVGFQDIVTSSSMEHRQHDALGAVVAILEEKSFAESLLRVEGFTQEVLDAAVTAWQEMAKNPKAYWATPFLETVGRKPESS